MLLLAPDAMFDSLFAVTVCDQRVAQILSFGAAAWYSGMWYLRWVRAARQDLRWGQLRLFCGLVCAGSVAGTVAWCASLQKNAVFYEIEAPGVTRRQAYALLASTLRFAAVFFVMNGFEFLCLIVSKLVLLGRLADSATQSSQENVVGMSSVRRRWMNGRSLPIVYRVMAVGVVVGSATGMVSNAVACAYAVQEAILLDQASAACDNFGNETNSSLAFLSTASVVASNSATAQSFQSGCEALTLLLVTIAFAVVVSLSVAVIRIVERIGAQALLYMPNHANAQPSAMVVADTMQAAAQQRRRLIAACVIVLVTFPARAAFDLLLANALFSNVYNPSCGPCDPCQSTSFLISTWLLYTPEFQPIVVAVSSPLPLGFSIWLLTKAHARMQLIAADVQRASAGDGA